MNECLILCWCYFILELYGLRRWRRRRQTPHRELCRAKKGTQLDGMECKTKLCQAIGRVQCTPTKQLVMQVLRWKQRLNMKRCEFNTRLYGWWFYLTRFITFIVDCMTNVVHVVCIGRAILVTDDDGEWKTERAKEYRINQIGYDVRAFAMELRFVRQKKID